MGQTGVGDGKYSEYLRAALLIWKREFFEKISKNWNLNVPFKLSKPCNLVL